MLDGMVVRSAIEILRLQVCRCPQMFQQPPGAGLDADTCADLTNGCGLFIQLPVHEREPGEFNGST